MTTERFKLLIGISGSISANVAQFYIYNFRKNLAIDIDIIATDSALDFVTPQSLKVFSNGRVFNREHEIEDMPIPHIELGKSYNLMMVMPCTANSLAKIANGFSSDLLSAVIMVAEMPVVLVPVMNPKMWANPAVMHNVELLQKRGYEIVPPIQGETFSGETGVGAMPEFSDVFKVLEVAYHNWLKRDGSL